jgi:hypothetical protein
MTATIKVEVDEALARRFKKKALEKYGYKKGAMKKALEELMEGYADHVEKANWNSLRGALKDGEEYKDMTSVELQHSIWRITNDSHRHKRIS